MILTNANKYKIIHIYGYSQIIGFINNVLAEIIMGYPKWNCKLFRIRDKMKDYSKID